MNSEICMPAIRNLKAQENIVLEKMNARESVLDKPKIRQLLYLILIYHALRDNIILTLIVKGAEK